MLVCFLQIPLPPRSDVLDEAVLKDFENRAQVGPQALPSILFHTFANTFQSLNCSAFAPDAQAVAGVVSQNEPSGTLAGEL